MTQLDAPALVGRLVRLEPLRASHAESLAEAATIDRSTYGYTSVPSTLDAMRAHIGTLLAEHAAGDAVPFVQVQARSGEPVGMTRFLSIRRRGGTATPYAVEIGGTWLASSAQRTGINIEAKLLLLAHAFDTWSVGRVDFKTDARNARSRAALLGLGATFEGVLRSWQPSHAPGEQDDLRDSAFYSVTNAEWPTVRDHLARRLST